MRRSVILAAVLLLMGAGCDALPSSDPAAATAAIALEPGLSFTVRPSALGLSGGFEEVFGLDLRALAVEVIEADPERALTLGWKTGSATGTLSLGSYEDAHAMLLPAFWTAGDASAKGNGGLWLSRGAYEELADAGVTEWRLGLADGVFSALSKAMQVFYDVSAKLSGSATSPAPAAMPFTVKKTAVIEAYPLTVDGRIVLVRAVKASSWFAEFLILENPDNPLIIKVTVNPLAAPALKAFEPAEVRWEELGYEITSISRP